VSATVSGSARAKLRRAVAAGWTAEHWFGPNRFLNVERRAQLAARKRARRAGGAR